VVHLVVSSSDYCISQEEKLSKMTTIRYFIPEDGDMELNPNIFLAPRSRHAGAPPTLGQIKSSFPLPGRYHFRFKSPLVPGGDRDKNAVAVWMDCVDDRQPIPLWKSYVVVKVTRIGVEEDDEEDDDFDDSDFGPRDRVSNNTIPHEPVPPTPAMPTQPSEPMMRAEPMLDIFDGTVPQPIHAAATPHSSHSAPSSSNLFDVPPSAPAHSSLLDMHTPSTDYSSALPSANDFLGMTAPPPAAHAQPQAAPGQPYGATTPMFQQQQPGQQQQMPGQQQQMPGQQQQMHHAQQQQQQQQPPPPHYGNQGPFGGLGTPWNT